MPTVIAELKALADAQRALGLQRFFKTGPGEYGEGDRFLGITVPVQRQVAHRHRLAKEAELEQLLKSPFHEARLTAVFILVQRYQKALPSEKAYWADFYIKHRAGINNWDLVDSSAPYILGDHFRERDKSLLYDWACKGTLWERRMAILACFTYIREGEFEDAFKLAELFLKDPEDLMHKAVGWMLREIGKRDRKAEEKFLQKYAVYMPRTMLRYAIEHFSPERRHYYIAQKRILL